MPVLTNSDHLSAGSSKRVTVECDFKISDKCKKVWTTSFRNAVLTKDRNQGQVICLNCSRLLKHSGRKNPNCKYSLLNDRIFEFVDTEEVAYLLGWIASDGSVSNRGFALALKSPDIPMLSVLRDIVCKDIPITQKRDGRMVEFVINSQQISADLCNLLNINPGLKSDSVCFPKIASKLKWPFIRGVFDGDGNIRSFIGNRKYKYPECKISSSSSFMKKSIQSFTRIPSRVTDSDISWSGDSSMKFLSKIYDNTDLYLLRKRETYEGWKSIRKFRKSSPY